MINKNSKMNVKNIETTNHKLKALRVYDLQLTALPLDRRTFSSATPDETRNGTTKSGWRIADSGIALHLGLFIL